MKTKLQFKVLLSLFALLAAAMLNSCSESGTIDQGDQDEELPTITLSTTTLAFDADGNPTDGLAGLVQIATTNSWYLSIDESSALSSLGWGWSIDNKSGYGNGSFTLEVTPTTELRTATIKVSIYSDYGTEVYKEVTITQNGINSQDKEVKVSEIVALMGEDSAIFSSEYNYILDVVVTEVSARGVVYAQQIDSTDAGEGIALNGSNLASLYTIGDQLEITIPAAEGVGCIENGAPELDHSSLTVVKGNNTAVTPIEISAEELNSNAYVNMYVTLKDVTVAEATTWTDGLTDGRHRFSVNGTTVIIFAAKGESELVDAGVAATTGNMTGIGGTSQIASALSVSKASNVSAFEFTSPLIQSITPESYQFPIEGGEMVFVIEGVNLKDCNITLSSSQFTTSVDNSTNSPTITISTTENTSGSDIVELITVSSEGGNSVDITVSQDDGYLSIPEVIDLIKEWGGSAETDYTGDSSFKFKAIVSATLNDGAYNLNKGQVSLVTENCTEPGNGLIFSLGSGYTSLLYSYDFTLGDEVEIEIFPATVGTTVTASDGTTRSQGVRMNYTSYPLLVAFDSDCATVTKTGRTGIEVPIPTIAVTDYYSYEAMLVKMELTTSAAGSLSTSTNQTHWIFSNTISGSYTVSFKTGNTSECIFLGKSYIATTAEATGLALSYLRSSAYFQPQTLNHFANFLAE